MAYAPIAPLLTNGSVLTQDHIAHIEAGITGAETYAEEVAAAVQAGAVTDAAIDAALQKAIDEGRLETGGGTSEPVNVVETQPGVYEITGLTITETEPGIYQIGA